MKRVTAPVEALSFVLEAIPGRLGALAHRHELFVGDAVFAGLHRYEDSNDGRSYRTMAHVVYPEHSPHLTADRRAVTLVLPTPRETPLVIAHELGHVIHYHLDGESWWAEPVSWYAQTNHAEAFAEAFTAWLFPGYADERLDGATEALFDSLALDSNV